MPAYLKHAGIEQHLNQQSPLSTTFSDETGLLAPLGHSIGVRPTVMALVYYKCAMMCPEVLAGLATGLRQTAMRTGEDYSIITLSIDPLDTPSDRLKKRATFVGTLEISSADKSVHFLTGSPPGIEAICSATGFEYVRVPGPNGKVDQFAHRVSPCLPHQTGACQSISQG